MLSVVVTGIDCGPSRFSGQSIFSIPSANADILPATDGSLTKMPTELLCRYGAVAQTLVSEGVR